MNARLVSSRSDFVTHEELDRVLARLLALELKVIELDPEWLTTKVMTNMNVIIRNQGV